MIAPATLQESESRRASIAERRRIYKPGYNEDTSVARQVEVWHRAMTNSISISSSSGPASEVAFPPFDWWKRAIGLLSWRWGAAGRPDSFPRTSWSIHRWFWRPKLGLRGFFNMRFFRHATIFHGCAVGGGSITYASTLLPPPEKVWDTGSWTGLADWKSEMPRHYQTASRMLGVTQNRILGPADQLLQESCGSCRLRPNLLPHQRRHLPARRGRTRRPNLPRSILRRRGTAANHLHRLRRLHDGLPLSARKIRSISIICTWRKSMAARSFQRRR